jgi:large subunit ribosomal protein L15
MKLHELVSTPGAKTARTRKGRGESSGKGKTSGKGNKGQKSRTGHKHRPLFEGGQMPLIRRIPKRGFTNARRIEFEAVNIGEAVKVVKEGDITAESLKAVSRISGKAPLKILGGGEIAEARTVVADAFSASAKEKIEKAGGTCRLAGVAASGEKTAPEEA